MERFGHLQQGEVPELGEMPPELAEAAKVLRQRLHEAVQRAKDLAASHPTDPDLLRLMEQMMKPPAGPDQPKE
jgi:hypothetical protein